MKRAHFFQHVPFEGLGAIEDWLKQHGYQITSSPLHASAEIPEVEAVDFLFIMGGPMSVNDRDQYPWLDSEIAFIREYLKSEKPLLGICLGAQLIAAACDAAIYPNPEKEIGWFPINNIHSGHTLFDDGLKVLHWHGETFDLPETAEWLACSEVCLHQAFRIGTQVIGLQFHLETTKESLQSLIDHSGDELNNTTYVQSKETLESTPKADFETANQALYRLLNTLTSD